LAAGFVLLVTNLPSPAWPLARVAWLYRLRWQIELAIKRLKSLLQIDHLRLQDPDLVQTYLLGKLLMALMLDELNQQVFLQQPDWFYALDRPVSLWRLTQFGLDRLRQWIMGSLNWDRFLRCLPALRRYFCDSPSARPQQLAWARALFDRSSASAASFGGVGSFVSA
jgi:hypothetical protein